MAKINNLLLAIFYLLIELNSINSDNWKLVYEEDFNNATNKFSKWWYETTEFTENQRWTKDNIKIENGILSLEMNKVIINNTQVVFMSRLVLLDATMEEGEKNISLFFTWFKVYQPMRYFEKRIYS